MLVMKLSSPKYIACPISGFRAPTRSIAVLNNEEVKGLAKLPVWWHCMYCDEWHILGFYPSVINEKPQDGLDTSGLTETFHQQTDNGLSKNWSADVSR
jgi:hypothetical protein